MPDAYQVTADTGIEGLPEAFRARFDRAVRLPQGAFGQAWRVQERSTGAPMVLRLIAPGPAGSNQFSNDLRKTAESTGHCMNAVHIADIVDGAGGVWLLRDWVEGESLAEALETLTVLTHEQARTLIGSVCRGLLGNEQQHVIHGNLDPNNVLIDMNGRVAVSDHGFRSSGAEMLGNKSIHFQAPEVVAGGPPTVQSDVYSLGALLYESLCGMYPLPLGANVAANQHILAAHTIVPPPRGVRLAGGIGNVIWRSFQLKPEDRFTSVEMFLEALSRTKSGEPTSVLGRLQSGLIGD